MLDKFEDEEYVKTTVEVSLTVSALQPYLRHPMVNGFIFTDEKKDGLGFCRMHRRNHSLTRTYGATSVILTSTGNGILRSDWMSPYDVRVSVSVATRFVFMFLFVVCRNGGRRI